MTINFPNFLPVLLRVSLPVAGIKQASTGNACCRCLYCALRGWFVNKNKHLQQQAIACCVCATRKQASIGHPKGAMQLRIACLGVCKNKPKGEEK